MFKCSKCNSTFHLPVCGNCGYEIKKLNNIWQLSYMPDVVTEGEDKYIGYEHINDHYSGKGKYLIEEKDALFAKELADLTGDGIFLDLACGDGCFTVPCASYGIKIIAGDISNNMLSILQRKAELNQVSLATVTLCRMNALDIPLEDESVDTVVANSMLHLFSHPEKVVTEIYRVLKKGGVFVCKDDRAGINRESDFDNTKYNEIVDEIVRNYYNYIRQKGIMPIRYSWKFDRNSYCDNLFADKTEKVVNYYKEYETPLKDGFLPRLCSRGFSDQVNITQELHEEAVRNMLSVVKKKYGENFSEVAYKGVENDLLITVYRK